MSETLYWIWLAGCLGTGSRHLHYLLDRYSSPYEVFRAESEELERLDLSERIISALCNKDMQEAYAINDYCASHRIGIISYESEYYPAKLRLIADPPAVLYFRGKLPNMNDYVSVGVVGTRKMSEYGKRSAYKISYELASAGVTVVSGMALGIDAVAACGAITGGGSTVAVLGSGVDVIYPPKHAVLYEKIIENGAVISEYPPTTEVRPNHFPARNRIISGMTNGTLVVECDLKSGAMITAEYALKQGRDIFAIPGNIGHKNANGTNKLLHDGAIMVTSTEDILREYEFYYGKTINYIALSTARNCSELSEDALTDMGICSEDTALKAAANKDKLPRTNVANLLKPRKVPKNKTAEKMPSTEKENIKEERQERDISTEEELAKLTEHEREMFLAMPDDRATGVDAMMRLGYNCSDVMGTLAMLEIKGYISSLPGGLYIKN
ncbi:MAG: DNA-processing protein DprA [Clostridia bacterium]|nr:DNA-processing protein DprA [Clostridia bacterium]